MFEQNDLPAINRETPGSDGACEVDFSMGDFGYTDPTEAYRSEDDGTHPVLEVLGTNDTNPMVTYEVGDMPDIEMLDASWEDTATNEIPLPNDIGRILDTRLAESSLGGADTEKFYVVGRPDLLVRFNEGIDADLVHQSKASADRMIRHGINVLPSTVVPHRGEVYVVTQLVYGCDLQQALIDNPSDEFLNEVDQTWKGVCDGLVNCMQTNNYVPTDITSSKQYMYGTTATDPIPKIWLVDLPSCSIGPNTNFGFANELMEAADDIREIERLTGRSMSAARQAIENALGLCPLPEIYVNNIHYYLGDIDNDPS